MSVFLSPVGGAGAQFFDNNGNPLTGGKLYTYAAGTTMPQATYTSAAGSVFQTNPIILDAAGRVPGSSEIWLSDNIAYKFVLKTSNDVLLATWDNITGVNSNFVNYITETEVQTATVGQTIFTLTGISYAPGTNSLTVFVDGVNQYEGVSYAETDSTTVTFTAGLHAGALVKFTTAVQITGNAADASVVTYTPPFTGSVATTVEEKLAQTISAQDFGAVGDGVTDDYAACQALINYFKSLGVPTTQGIDMQGRGIDWTGCTCALSQTLNIVGMMNYTFINPSFVAYSSFTGTTLLRVDAANGVWYTENITFINPYFDAKWKVDYCIEAYAYLQFKIVAGKFRHYKKAGIITGTNYALLPHELNLIGTVFFQRDDYETYPAGITEGQAFDIYNPDNRITNVIVGYHKQKALTLHAGSNTFTNCHFYTGNGDVDDLSDFNTYIGCYFDTVPLSLTRRATVIGNFFWVNTVTEIAIKFPGTDPYANKVTNNIFRGVGLSNTKPVIEMLTTGAGRIGRPIIYDNVFDGVIGLQTCGNHSVPISAASTTFAIPDQYLPLSGIGAVGKPAAGNGSYQNLLFGTAYDSVNNQITIDCFAVSGGSLTGGTMGGKPVTIDMNPQDR